MPHGAREAFRSLSPRYRPLLPFLAAGLTNAEIARRTGLTVHTVEKYVSQIMEATELPSACTSRSHPQPHRGWG